MSKHRALMSAFLLLLVPVFVTAGSVPTPIIDAHLHYNADDAAELGAPFVISKVRAAGVSRAIVTSRPPELVLELHQQAPELIVPILGVYQDSGAKEDWHQDETLPTRVARALQDPRWRGLGELHLFADQRHSFVFLRLVDLATDRQLPMLMHTDPAVIDRLFDHRPDARVIWAHAGAYPYPPLLANYLARYPGLYLDLSMRDERIAPHGVLRETWADFIFEHSERLLIGVDTYRTQRWRRYGAALDAIETWLAQLPVGVRDALAFENAERLFLGNR